MKQAGRDPLMGFYEKSVGESKRVWKLLLMLREEGQLKSSPSLLDLPLDDPEVRQVMEIVMKWVEWQQREVGVEDKRMGLRTCGWNQSLESVRMGVKSNLRLDDVKVSSEALEEDKVLRVAYEYLQCGEDQLALDVLFEKAIPWYGSCYEMLGGEEEDRKQMEGLVKGIEGDKGERSYLGYCIGDIEMMGRVEAWHQEVWKVWKAREHQVEPMKQIGMRKIFSQCPPGDSYDELVSCVMARDEEMVTEKVRGWIEKRQSFMGILSMLVDIFTSSLPVFPPVGPELQVQTVEAYGRCLMDQHVFQEIPMLCEWMDEGRRVVFLKDVMGCMDQHYPLEDRTPREQFLRLVQRQGISLTATMGLLMSPLREGEGEVEDHYGAIQWVSIVAESDDDCQLVLLEALVEAVRLCYELQKMDKVEVVMQHILYEEHHHLHGILSFIDEVEEARQRVTSGVVHPEAANPLMQAAYHWVAFEKLMLCLQATQSWRRTVQQRPLEDIGVMPTEGVAVTQKVVGEIVAREHSVALEEWRRKVKRKAQEAVQQVHGILAFPGGWMEGSIVRVRMFPHLINTYYSIHYEMGQYRECVQLVNLVADRLHADFTPADLRAFLGLSAQAAMCLLAANKSPY